VIGGENYSGSATGTLVISPATSLAAVVSSANPALAESAVTFTATVTSAAGSPAGTVSFLDGTTVLGQGTLSGGMCTLTTSALAAGSHSITAVYGGATDFLASTSSVLTQSVLNFSLSPGTGGGGGGTPITSQTVSSGGTATYPLTIVPTAGTIFPTPVTLTVTGMPPGATATITPSTWTALTATSWSFPANTPIDALSLIVHLPTLSARMENPIEHLKPRNAPALAWAILLLPFSGSLRRFAKSGAKTVLPVLLLLSTWGATLLLSGCGSSGFFAPNQKTYVITVTATSGTLSHSTTLTLTVKQ